MSKKAEKREVKPAAEQEGLHDPGTGPSPEDEEISEELRLQWEDRLGELTRERDEFRDLLLRKQAEFDNYRKRTLREREGFRAAAQAEVLRALLPTLDACQAGFKSMPEEDDDPRLKSYRDGYVLLVKEIEKVLREYGVKAVPGEGQPFDPNLHEAVMREESSQHPDGTILEEFRKGYRIGDYLLRPSQVKVSVRSEDEPGGDAGEKVKVDIKA